MAKGLKRRVVEGAAAGLSDLYDAYGAPLVRKVLDVLGPDVEPTVARKAVIREAKTAGLPPVSVTPRQKPAVRQSLAAPSFSVVPRQRPALPAPPKVLALPAPSPSLPPHAAKPRGGQFYPDTPIGPIDAQAAGYTLDNFTDRNGIDRYQVLRPEGTPVSGYHASTPEGAWNLANVHYLRDNPPSNRSPEAAARMAREEYGLYDLTAPNEQFGPGPQSQLGDWLERTLAKYYKTDFGSPNDPLRDLAERGLHYDPTMTPERWQRDVNDVLMEDPIGYFTVPRHESDVRAGLAGAPENFSFLGSHDPVGQGALMQAAPWLRKQPVTDMLYGIRDSLDLEHFTDEMSNALRAQETGLPMDLAVRPESLDRMTFAQAAEHVGKINQFRAKEMERAALAAQDNPVTQTFKEYAENNPMGLRWVEMAPPKTEGPANYDVEEELRKALKYEGDTMGHCVGGYCPDVMSGRSRIFSLRDAKGEPHVTVETKPRPSVFSDLVAHLGGDESLAEDYLTRGFQARNAGSGDRSPLSYALEEAGVPQGQDIVQIKGKQNRAPKDDYLPFVQDFVKSGQWGNVGDLGNAQLVKLPDGRYITQQQYDDVVHGEGLHDLYQSYDFNANGFPRDPSSMNPEDWAQFARHFEGYAIGGRVDADRCFCHNPLSVKKVGY